MLGKGVSTGVLTSASATTSASASRGRPPPELASSRALARARGRGRRNAEARKRADDLSSERKRARRSWHASTHKKILPRFRVSLSVSSRLVSSRLVSSRLVSSRLVSRLRMNAPARTRSRTSDRIAGVNCASQRSVMWRSPRRVARFASCESRRFRSSVSRRSSASRLHCARSPRTAPRRFRLPLASMPSGTAPFLSFLPLLFLLLSPLATQ